MRYLTCVGVLFLVLVMGAFATAQADGRSVYAKCIGCHGVDGTKAALGASPPVKGQSADELEKKMHGYVDGSYGGSKKVIMVNMLKKLSPEEIREVAEYMAEF